MVTWLKNFIMDETAFVRFLRASIAAGGAAVAGGMVPVIPQEAGPIISGMAVAIGAGDKNPAEVAE